MLVELPCDEDGAQQVDQRAVLLLHFGPDLLVAVWRCPGACRRRLWHAFPLARWPEMLRSIGVAAVYRPAVLVDRTVSEFRARVDGEIDTVVAEWRDGMDR